MKPKAHFHLLQVTGIFLAILSAGAVLGLGIYYRDTVVKVEWLFGIFLFGVFILAPILFRTLVAPKLSADCTQCGGRTYLTGSKTYTCSHCGHKTDLNRWGATGEISKKIYDAADKE